MSIPITIYLPMSTVEAIRDSAGINSNIRAVAHATAVTMPAVIAAVNNIPADVVAGPITPTREARVVPPAAPKRQARVGLPVAIQLEGPVDPPITIKRESPVDPPASNKRKKRTFEILVRNSEALIHAIYVDNNTPIRDLYKEYSRRSGLPVGGTILMYNGERMRGGKLGDYEVEEGAIIEAHRELLGS